MARSRNRQRRWVPFLSNRKMRLGKQWQPKAREEVFWLIFESLLLVWWGLRHGGCRLVVARVRIERSGEMQRRIGNGLYLWAVVFVVTERDWPAAWTASGAYATALLAACLCSACAVLCSVVLVQCCAVLCVG